MNHIETIRLAAEARQEKGKKMRAQSLAERIPAVVYGRGMSGDALWVKRLDFEKAYRLAGESAILALTVGDGAAVTVLIHDTQFDAVTGKCTHVDFLQVRMDEAIETHVPLTFVGEAPAVKTLGGMLLKTIDEVEVSCLPSDLPHAISVDISTLEDFDRHITVGDLAVPAGVKILNDAQTMVAGVTPPRTTAEMESLNEKTDADVTKVTGVVKEKDVAQDASKVSNK
jgi:large subunit ribosomal protein L25